MIIDTTISAMEVQMGKLRHVDEVLNKKSDWNHFIHIKKSFRPLSIKNFLTKQGKTPEQSMNYIVFWENGKIIDAQPLVEPTEEEKIQAQLREDKKRLQELLNKFACFIKYASNTRKNPKLSE